MGKSLRSLRAQANVVAMTEDQARAAIAEAEKAGFDLSLVDSNLALSIEQRLLRHDAALEFKLALRVAGEVM